jgi:hypothetical protein
MGKNKSPRKAVVRTLQLAALSALVVYGCATAPPETQQVSTLPQLSAEVQEAWQSHRQRLVNIVQGERFSIAEYAAAVEFFETVTQLKAHDNGSYSGRLPTDELESDIEDWDAWLAIHAACLRWNAAQSVVECVR